MLKKSIHIALILNLILAMTGFSVAKHYCGDRLISVDVNTTEEPCCGNDSDCCSQEMLYLQLDEEVLLPVLFDEKYSNLDYDICIPIIHLTKNIEDKYTSSQPLIPDAPSPPCLMTRLTLKQSFLI